MSLAIVDLLAVGRALEQPFFPEPVAKVGHLLLSVFVCEGELEWHKHLDEDELFLVLDGQIRLDTDRGALTLLPEELAVVPKGTLHRSRSEQRSLVALLRPEAPPLAGGVPRTNGHYHFYSTAADPALEKVRLAAVAATMAAPFQPTVLGRVAEYELLLAAGRGLSDEWTAPAHGALWWVVRGRLRVETSAGEVAELGPGEVTGAPAGERYRLICPTPAVLLTLARS